MACSFIALDVYKNAYNKQKNEGKGLPKWSKSCIVGSCLFGFLEVGMKRLQRVQHKIAH